MPAAKNMRAFGPNASILLDVLRFSAALAVALTHLPLFMARGDFISEHSGNTAVCVFFVLSGFVMRYVTVTRVNTGRDYCIDRISRMYSVVAPALLITVVLEWISMRHAPSAYAYSASTAAWQGLPTQLAQNLTFTVGWWDFGTPPLSNGVFWSLSFECVYYALYGLLKYAPRARWVVVPLLLLLVGPAIALLFPIWLLGAGLYDVYARLHGSSRGLRGAALVCAAYLAALFLLRRQIFEWLRATDLGGRQQALTHFIASFAWGRDTFHGAQLHWLDRLSVSYFLTGTLLVVALLPVLLALDRIREQAGKTWVQRVRLVADSTFTLYLIHMPMLLLLMTFSHGPWSTRHAGLTALALVIAMSIVLARVFDRLKNGMRSRLRVLPWTASR